MEKLLHRQIDGIVLRRDAHNHSETSTPIPSFSSQSENLIKNPSSLHGQALKAIQVFLLFSAFLSVLSRERRQKGICNDFKMGSNLPKLQADTVNQDMSGSF